MAITNITPKVVRLPISDGNNGQGTIYKLEYFVHEDDLEEALTTLQELGFPGHYFRVQTSY